MLHAVNAENKNTEQKLKAHGFLETIKAYSVVVKICQKKIDGPWCP